MSTFWQVCEDDDSPVQRIHHRRLSGARVSRRLLQRSVSLIALKLSFDSASTNAQFSPGDREPAPQASNSHVCVCARVCVCGPEAMTRITRCAVTHSAHSTTSRRFYCALCSAKKTHFVFFMQIYKQEGIAVASIARDDPSTVPGDDPFPRVRMHRDRNAR